MMGSGAGGSGRGGGGGSPRTVNMAAEGYTITRTDTLRYPGTTSTAVRRTEITVTAPDGRSVSTRFSLGGLARGNPRSVAEATERALREIGGASNINFTNPPRARVTRVNP